MSLHQSFYMFVYGTLMRGYCNNFLMNKCTFVANATTVNEYAMFSKDYPFVTEKKAVSVIEGEVYEILDEETLKLLDQLEGHPDEYTRKPVEVVLENGNRLIAELYFNEHQDIEDPDTELVFSGRFMDAQVAAMRRKN